MAYFDGICTLEYWIKESVYNVSDATRAKIVAYLDERGYRETIESALYDYAADGGDECRSWRSVRNGLWHHIDEAHDEAVGQIIKEGEAQ